MRTHRILVIAAYLLSAWVTGGQSQTVSGKVVDDATRRPIAGASVRLLSQSGEQAGAATTDRTGSWAILAPEPGIGYRVEVDRIGYSRIESGAFDIGLSPVTINLATRQQVVVLEGISAQGLNYMGLLNRSATRISAKTLLPDDIAARVGRLRRQRTGELLKALIANMYMGQGGGDWPQMTRVNRANGESVSRGLGFRAADFRSPWDRGPQESHRECAAIVAVDGVPYFQGRPQWNLEALVPVSSVRAIEVFTDPNYVPRELDLISRMHKLDRPPDNRLPCGVVAIWTKDGLGVP